MRQKDRQTDGHSAVDNVAFKGIYPIRNLVQQLDQPVVSTVGPPVDLVNTGLTVCSTTESTVGWRKHLDNRC